MLESSHPRNPQGPGNSVVRATRAKTSLPALPMVVDSVRIGHLRVDKPLPLVAEPTDQNIDLVTWTKRNIDLIESALLTEGSVLFRGFGSASIESFANLPTSLFQGTWLTSSP